MAAAQPYLISKIADPLFAIFIGTSAAFVRIRREEQEKSSNPVGFRDTFSIGRDRVGKELDLLWNGPSKSSGPKS